MTMLSDATIKRMLKNANNLVIDPMPADHQLQPASVDLRLGGQFLSPYGGGEIRQSHYTILPNECVLATTFERVEIGAGLVARVEGKSSWGRKFLMVHSTAGFIDPGFKGQITLELKNLSNVMITLPVGCMIAQISFQWLDGAAERPYGTAGLNSHYQNQIGVAASASVWS